MSAAVKGRRGGLERLLARNGSIALAYALCLALLIIGGLHSAGFAEPRHVKTILITASFVGFVGFGQTLCILTGGIDLSIPSTMAGAAVLTAFLADGDGARLVWILPLVFGIAFAIGAINGTAIAYAGVPPIIMTLGMNGALQGLLLVYTNGGSAASPPKELVSFVGGSFVGIPYELVVWLAVIALATVLLTYTTFGRRLYAVGTNPRAALLAGIDVRRVLLVPYVVSALAGALAGILLLGFLGQAFVTMGDDYLFSSAVAVAVGGASILGGNGHYVGTVAGAILLTLIAALLPLFSLGTAALQISYGLILLATVFLAGLRRSGRRL